MSKVALVATGGTVAAMGRDAFDVVDYDAGGWMMDLDELLRFLPPLGEAELVPIAFGRRVSAGLDLPDWHALAARCRRVVDDDPQVNGIVVLHGTASMEEAAYLIHLVWPLDVPVVFTGAQRPPTALSSDAAMNLRNAIRVAACVEARGAGVLVVMNDEIHAAREVTKASTMRLQAFRSPDFGLLGHCDGDAVCFYRRPARRRAELALPVDLQWPRVDVAYAYAGADGTAVRAFASAGAQGIVSAGFAPGCTPPAEHEALEQAVARGLVVVQCSRAGSGRVPEGGLLSRSGFVGGDNLSPQKARILLSVALAVGLETDGIREAFRTY